MLCAERLVKRYGERTVLAGTGFTAKAGESVAVVGPSGSGKSTLLNLLGSLDRPDSGSVQLGSTRVDTLSGRELQTYRATQVGFVFQEHHLLPQLTALENVLLAGVAAHVSDATDRGRDLLSRLGIGDRADSFPGQLSGGERQRVAVARAMLLSPKLLLCDEPTGSLDRDTGARVLTELLALAAERQTIALVVTHNSEHAGRCARRLLLKDGILVPPASHAS